MANRAEIEAELIQVEAQRRALQKREGELRDRLLLADEAPDVAARVEAGGPVHPFTIGSRVVVIAETSQRYGEPGTVVYLYDAEINHRYVVTFSGGQRLAFALSELAEAGGWKAHESAFAGRIAEIRRYGGFGFNEARQIALDEVHAFAIEYGRAVRFLETLRAAR